MKRNLLSIVTVCFNSAQYIEDCILSIKNQSSSDYEHIIVDGGSTDETLNIIKRYEGTYNMRWISETDNGMYDAIVKGFSMANGNIYAWLNSDDMYQKDAVKIVNAIFENPDIQWLTAFPIVYNALGMMCSAGQGMYLPVQTFMKLGYLGKGGCGLQQESTFWTSQLWDKANGIEISRYKYAGDIILWRMFAKYEPIYITDAIVSGFRKHSGQKSDNVAAYRKERWNWNVITVLLKVLHIPEICSMLCPYFEKNRLIRLNELFFDNEE